MSELRRILGTSLLSLLLVIWGLFMVCSGRVPEVNYDDDIANDNEYNGGADSELMNQLAVLDDESTRLEDYQRKEILEALGIDPTEARESSSEEQGFLTEELFLDLEVEIAELERQTQEKSEVIDSLQSELQETELRVAALNQVVEAPEQRYASSSPMIDFTNGSGSSDHATGYQDALDDVYSRQYTQAISKFRQLLKRMEMDDELADNCQYWIGESYYAIGNYESAIAEFEKVFAFHNNNKADDAQFMIGMAYIKLGDPALGQFELNNLMTFYQNSEYVVRAERQINELSI